MCRQVHLSSLPNIDMVADSGCNELLLYQEQENSNHHNEVSNELLLYQEQENSNHHNEVSNACCA